MQVQALCVACGYSIMNSLPLGLGRYPFPVFFRIDTSDSLAGFSQNGDSLHFKRLTSNKLVHQLEIYVTGSLNVFNHQTNVDINNRIVCFDIKELGKQLKKIGMLVIQDQVWNRVTMNRSAHKSTRYYVDEFHLLLKEEQTAAYSVEIWKRFRKWGGIPTGELVCYLLVA